MSSSKTKKKSIKRLEVKSHPLILEHCLTQPNYILDPRPVLVWPIPGYIPPPQSSYANKTGRGRSKEVNRLRDQRLWSVKTGEALCYEDPPMERRLVSITTWKTDKLYDQGNYIHACKALLDSLQPDIIRNDSLAHCADFYSQRLCSEDDTEPGTFVIVYRIVGVAELIKRFSFGEYRTIS